MSRCNSSSAIAAIERSLQSYLSKASNTTFDCVISESTVESQFALQPKVVFKDVVSFSDLIA